MIGQTSTVPVIPVILVICTDVIGLGLATSNTEPKHFLSMESPCCGDLGWASSTIFQAVT